MSPASPSMSAWVQHSVSPNASVSYDAPGIKPELGGVSLTAVCASSNSLSGSSPGDWLHHALPASQLGPESCICCELHLMPVAAAEFGTSILDLGPEIDSTWSWELVIHWGCGNQQSSKLFIVDDCVIRVGTLRHGIPTS